MCVGECILIVCVSDESVYENESLEMYECVLSLRWVSESQL